MQGTITNEVSVVTLCPSDMGQWLQLTLSPTTQTALDSTGTTTIVTFDATKITSIGLYFGAGEPAASITTSTFHIDNIGYR